MGFASRDIKKGDVLGFDYGEKFWVIKHKFFTCWCGLEKCKYSKTAIGRTLDNYYKKNKDQLQSPEEKQQTGKLKLKTLNFYQMIQREEVQLRKREVRNFTMDHT